MRGFLKWESSLLRLTEEGQQHWVVVRHDEKVDAGEGGAGLEVAKRVSQLTLLATAADKHLWQQQDHKAIKTKSTGESVTHSNGNNRRVLFPLSADIIFIIRSLVALQFWLSNVLYCLCVSTSLHIIRIPSTILQVFIHKCCPSLFYI